MVLFPSSRTQYKIGETMSGDTNCDLEALVFCPFCGGKTTDVQVHWELYEKDNKTFTVPIEGGKFIGVQFRIECEAKQPNSGQMQLNTKGRLCRAMEESGAYFLNVYPNGNCYAQYF